jgi:MFS family permease
MLQQLLSLGSHARTTVVTQLELVRFLHRDPRFRAPLIVIWVASFGGALHSPVTTYFYLKLGASDTDIGWIGACFSAGSIFTPPLYGYLMDRQGGYAPMMITVVLCAVGCLVRGLALDVHTLFVAAAILGMGGINLWNIVLAYLSTNTPKDRRSLVVSGFLFQVTSVRIVGTSLYPLWSRMLQVKWPGDDDATLLFRDRLSMGVCTFFCFFGLFELLLYPPSFPAQLHASSDCILPHKGTIAARLIIYPTQVRWSSTHYTPGWCQRQSTGWR